MTIGEKIASLRTSRNMSQGDLAEKLNVSRQSVSKWETNASIPDLDKVIQLSDIFQISIDELVRDNHIPSNSETIDSTGSELLKKADSQHPITTQRIVGFILLTLGLLCCILAFIFGGGLLLIGGYLFACSLVLLLIKHHAGLLIGWTTFPLAAILAPYYTGVHMLEAFAPVYDGLTINKIVAIIAWVLLGLLILCTIKAFRKRKK